MWMVWPFGNVSVIAGIRPLGLSSRNHGSFWTLVERSMAWTLYGWTVVSVEHAFPVNDC